MTTSVNIAQDNGKSKFEV